MTTMLVHAGALLRDQPPHDDFARGHAVGCQVYALLYWRVRPTPTQIERTVNTTWADTAHTTRWAAGYLTGWMKTYHEQGQPHAAARTTARSSKDIRPGCCVPRDTRGGLAMNQEQSHNVASVSYPSELLPLTTPRRCEVGAGTPEHCVHEATWQYNGAAVCHPCMRIMSDMNSDNADAFAPALTGHATEKQHALFGPDTSPDFEHGFEHGSLLYKTRHQAVSLTPRAIYDIAIGQVLDPTHSMAWTAGNLAGWFSAWHEQHTAHLHRVLLLPQQEEGEARP